MDNIDQQIVHLLSENGRMTHEELARVVPLSRPAVHERIKRLEAGGIIRGYHAQINWAALGQPLSAFIWVTSREKSEDTATALMHLNCPDAVIEECYGMTGEWCLLLKVRVASPGALKDLIDCVYTVPGVQNTLTNLSLAAYHEESKLGETLSQRDAIRKRKAERKTRL